MCAHVHATPTPTTTTIINNNNINKCNFLKTSHCFTFNVEVVSLLSSRRHGPSEAAHSFVPITSYTYFYHNAYGGKAEGLEAQKNAECKHVLDNLVMNVLQRDNILVS